MTVPLAVPSDRSYIVAVSLSAIFGVLGVHHFYLGRYLEGCLDLSLSVATVCLFLTGHVGWAVACGAVDGVHTFIITVMLLTGSFKDGQGRVVCYPGQRLR